MLLDRRALRRAVQEGAGVARDAAGLERLADYLAAARPAGPSDGPEAWELANMALAARVVTALAARRAESGAHTGGRTTRTLTPRGRSGRSPSCCPAERSAVPAELERGCHRGTEEAVGCPTAVAG